MRFRKAVICGAVSVAAFAVTFANEGEEAAFRGTWRAEASGAKSSLDRLVFTPSADGSSVAISGELVKGGAKHEFSSAAAIQGDVVEFDAQLARTGFLGKLEDEVKKDDTLHARCTLDHAAARIDAGWSTSSGASGSDVLSQLGTGWQEKPLGGSPEAEKRAIADLVSRVTKQQDDVAHGKDPQRGFHNKGFGVKCELRVAGDIAPDLQVGLFRPGAVYPAIARFSNAGANSTSDFTVLGDQRGLAFRVKTGKVQPLLSGATADAQDFLTTNSAITTRDPVEFLDVARALTLEPSELPRSRRSTASPRRSTP